MSIQEAAEQALEESLAELAAAEIQLMEATARAQNAREVELRLKNAIAALNGETPTSSSQEQVIPDKVPLRAERAETAAMTPEQFDAERKRNQRRRQKEEIENNPLGHLKCPGCGEVGKMTDQVMTTKGGGTVRMLACGGCGNQQLTG
ncbi:hypothetical protein LCGC14_1366940 [marine sediment metagenome]|uniref:Uncharacterized protein n=1 Tax=marine sediment metagenome TaxID=412755 RepID=A0A0F9K6U5_9ZZZZ